MTYARGYAILVNFLGYVYPIWICLPILPCDAKGDADAVLEVLVETKGTDIRFEGLYSKRAAIPEPVHVIMKPDDKLA